MHGHRTTARRPGVRVLAAAALPLGLVGSAGLAAGLAVRLRALLPVDASTATVDRVVEIGVVGLGLALLGWVVWGLAVATLCATARTVGLTWRAGERAVARHAPGVVRRVLVVALGAGLGVSGAVTAHAAAPLDGLDVGWSATTTAAPTPGTATAPAASPAVEATTSRPTGVTQVGGAPSGDETPAVAPTAVGTPAPAAAGVPQDAAGDGAVGAVPAAPTGAPAPSAATAGGHSTEPGADPARPGARSSGDVTTSATAARSASAQTGRTDATPSGTPGDPGSGSGAPGTAAHAPTGGSTVVVGAGDSLWRLAQHALGPDATDQEVAAEWPRWYAANADVIGADPDLLVPGQVLRVPGSSPAPGGTR